MRLYEALTVRKENPGGRRAFIEGSGTVSNRLFTVVKDVSDTRRMRRKLPGGGIANDSEQAAADFKAALEALVLYRQRARYGDHVVTAAGGSLKATVLHGIGSNDFGIV